MKNILIGALLVSCLILAGHAACAGDKVAPCKPAVKTEGEDTIYSFDNMGRYSFALNSRWKNVSNFTSENKINTSLFILKENPQEVITLTVSITYESDRHDKFFLGQTLKDYLLKKNIYYFSVQENDLPVNGRTAEEASVILNDDQAVTMIGLRYEELSLVTTMEYAALDIEAKSDLTALFYSFKKI